MEADSLYPFRHPTEFTGEAKGGYLEAKVHIPEGKNTRKIVFDLVCNGPNSSLI